jgi:hypothetical protein
VNSGLDIRGVRDQLRERLGVPGRERSAVWEDEVGRVVGMGHVPDSTGFVAGHGTGGDL